MTEEEIKSEKEAKEIFVKEFEALCLKHEFGINAYPVFIARDDGTFSVKLKTEIIKIPKKD